MAPHLLTVPREIRDQIYSYLLPGEEMNEADLWLELNAGMRSFLTLRAVNQQIRAGVIDIFKFSVPFVVWPTSRLPGLWGMSVSMN